MDPSLARFDNLNRLEEIHPFFPNNISRDPLHDLPPPPPPPSSFEPFERIGSFLLLFALTWLPSFELLPALESIFPLLVRQTRQCSRRLFAPFASAHSVYPTCRDHCRYRKGALSLPDGLRRAVSFRVHHHHHYYRCRRYCTKNEELVLRNISSWGFFEDNFILSQQVIKGFHI